MLNGNGTAPKVIVVGGSLGGLFNAIACGALASRSMSFEKSSGLMKTGVRASSSSRKWPTYSPATKSPARCVVVPVHTRRYLGHDGSVLQEGPMPQAMTSWDLLYKKLRAAVPDDCYHPGIRLAGFEARKTRLCPIDGGREVVSIC